MKKIISFDSLLSNGFLIIILNCFLFVACTKRLAPSVESGPLSYLVARNIDTAWISWNVMFAPGTTDASRTTQIASIESSIASYLAALGLIPSIVQFHCPCDPTLYNINVFAVDGSGKSFYPPPPPPPPHGGSGNDLAFVGNNYHIEKDSLRQIDSNSYYNHAKQSVNLIGNTFAIDTSKTLAIMDTGLDTTYFDNNVKNALWTDPFRTTLRNFTFTTHTSDSGYFFDDNPGKHGTGVTAIALQAMDSVSHYPRIMVLKVLDNAERGSTFTVSCALSYAAQNRATIINASLGYYAKPLDGIDTVLAHYLSLCNTAAQQPIFIFAAAGNIRGDHNLALCTTPIPDSNELKKVSAAPTLQKLFYPACFSDSLTNVITVTGLNDHSHSCIYQNYSSTYVSMGVLNAASCCEFDMSNLRLGFEGSSFATPVVSGKVMAYLLNHPAITVSQAINQISTTDTNLSGIIKDGRFTQCNIR